MHPNHSLQLYYFVWVFLIHFLLAFAVQNESILCKETEREALLNIKLHLIPQYGDLPYWGSERQDRDCCSWDGITCSNRTGHVTGLSFGGMIGKMSDSLLELKHLTYLDLSGNDFGGTQFPVHSKNASLTKLIHLDLFDSNFSGPISSFLSNLSSLQDLDLSHNHFTDIDKSDWISGLSCLTHLGLSGIPLIQPNVWLEIVSNKLLHLESLWLQSCFSGDEVHTLMLSPINSSSALTEIHLSNNNLLIPSIQVWLSNISHNIYSIDLSSNILLSADFDDKMISLEVLHLSNTTLVDSVPISFGNMSGLHYLDLSYNNFNTKLSDLIQKIFGSIERSLKELYLDSCQITGSLPDDLPRFSSLEYLYLSHNLLNGTISKSIGRLSRLRELDLSWNSLHCVISEDHFSNLTKLDSLDLSGNSLILNVSHDWIPPFNLSSIGLSGCRIGPHFPKWLQSQTEFYHLDISNAEISDSIPHWFWDLSYNPYYLNLSCNNITGELPTLSMMSLEMYVLDLSFNQLQGPLPFTQIPSEDSSFSFIDLSNNLFFGVIPDYIMNFQTLVSLNLASNRLYGEIPYSLGSLFDLQTLNLGNNELSGQLPFSLRNCTKLKFLDLSNNNLSGNIPSWIGENLLSLKYLSLQANKFFGIMPLQLCQMKNIQILDLSENDINGTIPYCLNNYSAMIDRYSNSTISIDYYTLYVGALDYMNKAIVTWKGLKYMLDRNLGRFRIINLSYNKLEGKIPREITTLANLQQLNLSNNKLSGSIPEEIDGLKQLESLDLSSNQLSGKLPISLCNLSSLNTLDVSHNKFSGRIPSGTQLQSFNISVYSNNPGLCGLPLPQKCSEDNIQDSQPNHDEQDDDEEDEFKKMLYFGMGIGFVVGFWGVSSTLLFKHSSRHAFFMFLDKSED